MIESTTSSWRCLWYSTHWGSSLCLRFPIARRIDGGYLMNEFGFEGGVAILVALLLMFVICWVFVWWDTRRMKRKWERNMEDENSGKET